MTAASYIYRSEIRSNTPFGLIIVRKEIAWKKTSKYNEENR